MYYSVRDFADGIKDLKDLSDASAWPPKKVVLEFIPAENDPALSYMPTHLRIEGGIKDDSLLDAKVITLVEDSSAEENTLSWDDLSNVIARKRSDKDFAFVIGDDVPEERAWLAGWEYDDEARVLELSLQLIGADELWL